MRTLKNQFLFDLEEIFEAEHRIAKALPRMVKSDTSDELKQAILSHASVTEDHVKKVELLFECFGHSVEGSPRQVAAGPRAEVNEIEDTSAKSLANEAALISALKMVEKGAIPPQGSQRDWEIASYGCLQEWAKLLGSIEGADLLEQILAEEESAGQRDPGRGIEKKAM